VIPVRLLNGSTIYLNTELLESVVATPDTIITLTSGRKIMARSSPEEILEAVVAYRRRVLERPPIDVAPPQAAAMPAPARPPDPRPSTPDPRAAAVV